MTSPTKTISARDCEDLLKFYWSEIQPVANLRTSKMVQHTQDLCSSFMKRDYDIIEVPISINVCPHYPPRLCIPLRERGCSGCSEMTMKHDSAELSSLFELSSNGRVRGRFLAPTILFHYTSPNRLQPDSSHSAKFIIRSGSLIQKPEMIIRSGKSVLSRSQGAVIPPDPENPNPSRLQAVRGGDRYVMSQLGIDFIFDLMIEDKVKRYGIQCASSEKVKHRNPYAYSKFRLIAIPYPGYEHFTCLTNYCKSKVRKNQEKNHIHDYLSQAMDEVPFNWNAKGLTKLSVQNFMSLPLSFPHLSDIQWSEYRTWNPVTMCGNYLRAILTATLAPVNNTEDQVFFWKGNLVVHCISGWDRTPVFISLIRILLWADGEIHKSLSPIEMLYFTLAYDWMLFGHNLAHRAKHQNVELLYFTFFMLDKLLDDKFSIHYAAGNPVDTQERTDRLQILQQLFIPLYNHICVLRTSFFPHNPVNI